ncbi:MAG: glycosyltransferase family 4 protein [Deltaproteobacteria bacterium]|nr:MAG: glycosyltransferase family 4 protein [Deltaproteobacteria bacterium]
MKTLLITQDFPPQGGGMQEYYLNICLNLPPEEIVVTVPKVEGYQEADKKLPFKVYRAPFPIRKAKIFTYNLIWLLQLIWIIRKERISTVQCGVILPIGYLSLILKWITRTKYVIYFHGKDILVAREKAVRSRFKKRLLDRIISRSSRLIVNSKYTLRILDGLNVHRDKCEVIYPGVELGFFRRISVSPEIIKRYNLENKRIILFVGRLIKRKGVDNVLLALPKVIEKIPNLKYLIVGKGDDEIRLRKIVEDVGLDRYVDFLGYISREDLLHVYNTSDVFVMASREVKSQSTIEGFGIVYLEANACGVPVVGGRSGGIPEAVIDGETGLLVDSDNIEEISQAILRILKDEHFARELGEKGRQRAEAEFSWDKITKRVHSVLEEL